MTDPLTRHLRIYEPHPGIFAYYDGRVPGHALLAGPNWMDDGAIALGIATYALIEGDQALVYDTHVSPAHGAAIRAHLEGRGARHFTVIYSHWHLDHVAGTAAFSGAQVIANARTDFHLRTQSAAIEAGTLQGLPAINPLILPSRTFTGQIALRFGSREVHLIEANIHSDDATVLWLPAERILLAGDTVEDCVTYVGEPADFLVHLRDLDRLSALGPAYVLPDHGAPEIIAAGGYGPAIIPATQSYIRWLMRLETEPGLAHTPLAAVIAADLQQGTLVWFDGYEDIHRQNIVRACAHFGYRAG